MNTICRKIEKKLGLMVCVMTIFSPHLSVSGPPPSLKAPDFSLSASEKSGVLEVVAAAPDGHHFNTKAPMAIQRPGSREKLHPARATEKSVRFEFPVSADRADFFSVVLFICDDRKTFCEKHSLAARWIQSEKNLKIDPYGSKPSAGKPEILEGVAVSLPKGEKSGFIVNDPQLALKRAKDEGKLILIDFFGIWCPPCNELDEEVFSSAEFKEETQAMIKLKLDADSPVSWELKSRFRVGGYPTVVLASPDLDEIHRVVGFRPKAEFLGGIGRASQSPSESFLKVKARADQGDSEASGKVGTVYLERGEYEQAVKYLSKAQNRREEFFDAKIGLLESKKADGFDAELVSVLKSSIENFPRTPASVDRRMKLAELHEEGGAKDLRRSFLEEAIRVSKDLIKDPALLRGYDTSVEDLWSTIATAYEKLGKAGDSRSAWSMAAQGYSKRIRSDHERGYNIERAYCLWKSGDTNAAEALYRKLESYYPREFTFYFNHARMSLDLKELTSAKDLAQKAYDFSYGDNRLRAAHLLAQVLKAEGKKDEAKKIIETVLAATSLPKDETVRTHRYAKLLRDLEKKL